MRKRQYDELLRQLGALADRMKTVEVSILVSGPNNPVVAEAYNGLRQQVVMAASERRTHLTQLAQFASAVDDGLGAPELASLVREWMAQHALVAVSPEARPDAYEIRGSGPRISIRKRAFVDERTGAVISLGQAIAAHRAPDVEPPAPVAAVAASSATEPEPTDPSDPDATDEPAAGSAPLEAEDRGVLDTDDAGDHLDDRRGGD